MIAHDLVLLCINNEAGWTTCAASCAPCNLSFGAPGDRLGPTRASQVGSSLVTLVHTCGVFCEGACGESTKRTHSGLLIIKCKACGRRRGRTRLVLWEKRCYASCLSGGPAREAGPSAVSFRARPLLIYLSRGTPAAASPRFQASVPSLGPAARFRAPRGSASPGCTSGSPAPPALPRLHQCSTAAVPSSNRRAAQGLIGSAPRPPLRRQPRPGPDRVNIGVRSSRASPLVLTTITALQTRHSRS
ncbi:hypothetical protein NDU88_006412 [Pleurodeles waltl]|uniref:Uncharacterized protein n=1 Tax=Pleurodeles waltl TaxID=8319 RepID=A0AAV7LQF6_PLEWA|nr:hypothetical protein NDU88_006412 [Pleurodeles waltl]